MSKKHRPPTRMPLTSEEGDSLRKELEEQTHRGAAIIGAGCVEVMLRDLIALHLRSGEVRQDKQKVQLPQEIFSPTGCLGSFRAKIDVAFCLGIIGRTTYEDAWHILKVRNLFAHRIEALTFDDPEIMERCHKLKLRFEAVGLKHNERDRATPREKYIGDVTAFISLTNRYFAAFESGAPRTIFP